MLEGPVERAPRKRGVLAVMIAVAMTAAFQDAEKSVEEVEGVFGLDLPAKALVRTVRDS